jgi:hypothetical protein
VGDLANLASEYEKPKKPKQEKSGGGSLAALAAAYEEKPAEQRKTGLALLKPPASMRETPQQATQRVEKAQAEDRQRRTAESAAAKGAPIATRPKTFAEQEQESEARRAPKKEKPGTITVAGAKVRPDSPKYKELKKGQEKHDKGVARVITFVGAGESAWHDVQNSVARVIAAQKPPKPTEQMTPAEYTAWNRRVPGLIMEGLAKSHPWRAFKDALKGKGTSTEALHILAQSKPKIREDLRKTLGVSPETADIVLEMMGDVVPGLAQAKVVGGLQKAVTGKNVTVLPGVAFKGVDVQAKAEQKIPRLGQALQGRRAYRAAGEKFNLAEAQQEETLRRVGEAANDLQATSHKYGKKIRVKDPLTGKTVNKLDQLVADYQEAGARGSRHELVSGGGKGPSIQKQQKQLERAQAVLPRRGKLAGQAQQKAAAAKTELQNAEAASRAAQQKLMAERKAQQQAAEVARKARAQAQAAVRQKAEAATLEAERSRSLTALRDKQAERAAKLKQAEAAVPALERDAVAAAKAHNEARRKATELENRARIAEGRAAAQKNQSRGMVRRSDTPGRQTQASNAHQKAGALRAEADAARQAAKQASENEARMLRQLQQREQEAERARAAAAQARRLTPSTEALTLARQRANAAAAAARKAEAEAAAAAGQAKQSWAGAKQAQQPVTAATREAGKAQQQLFTTQKLTTKAEKQAQRLTQRAAGAQMKVGVLGNQLSTPVQRAGMQARRAVELREVAKEATSHGIAFEDVKRLGENYRALSEELGQKLVGAGRMSPEAFERLKGFHLPRLYSLAASKPKEARKLLAELERKALVTSDVARELAVEIDNRARGISGRGAMDVAGERRLDTFAERMSPEAGRLVEGSATPAMTRYAQSATSDIAEAEAMREIVKNPMLARPSGTGERHWLHEVDVDGVKYQVDPGVKRYLDFRAAPDPVIAAVRRYNPAAAEAWQTLNKGMRQLWMSAPPSAINNAAGNYQLGAAAAAINGARYHLPGYVMAAKEWKAFQKSGKASGYLDEALNQTDLLAEGGGILPRGSMEIGSGFGVETAGQRFRQGLGNAKEAYQNALLRDPEKSARFYLYKELRASGKGVDEAARITRAAMIDYSDVGPLKKFLDQNNILPFLTFPTKAIFQYMNLAARRPDLFQTWTGERLRDLMDQLSDESAERKGLKPSAKERRASGAAGITSFPLPGQFDSQGAPFYMRSSALAPITMMAPFGRPDEAMDPLQFATERYNTSAPLFRAFGEAGNNYNTFLKRPIVEEGSVPGSLNGIRDAWRNPEAAGAFALDFAKRFLPQAGQAERLYHGYTDTTAYPGRNAPKQTLGQALIQTFTGAAIREGLTDQGSEWKGRGGARADDPKHQPFVQFADKYELKVLKDKYRNPQFVQDAQQLKTYAKAKAAHDAIKKKYNEILTSDFYSGETRYKQIRQHLDWLYALGDRVDELDPGKVAGAAP